VDVKGAVLVLALFSVAVLLAGCGSSSTPADTTTEAAGSDLESEVIAAAVPITWDGLMAGAPKETILEVTGTVGEPALGTNGVGLLSVEGDPDHLLLFKLAPDYERAGLVFADKFPVGEVTLYGTARGEPGIETRGGPDMVRMFYVGVVRPGASPGQAQAGGTDSQAN
jgi:hypothetical protein